MPLYMKDKIAFPYKGDGLPARLFCGNKEIAGWRLESASGSNLYFKDTYNFKPTEALMRGNTQRTGDTIISSSTTVREIGSKVSFDRKCSVETIDGITFGDDTVVCDTLNWSTGELVKNTNKITFDGNSDEDWYERDVSFNGIGYLIMMPDDCVMRIDTNVNERLLCSHLPLGGRESLNTSNNMCMVLAGALYVNIPVPQKTDIREWLKNNPLTIVYPARTPKTTIAEIDGLETHLGGTRYTTASADMDITCMVLNR